MSGAGVLVQRCRRWSALGLVTLLAATAASQPAEARRHHRHHSAATADYEPPYSSIVVDANSGAVLQATSPDALRHPASLTKIMTLYLLFERLEAGKIKMSTEMEVSPHAASQAPSKLDLKPGQTIDVETAIRAVVTKSANDVAVVIAEALGGSEENFARMMTAKARSLGMMHTVYRDASGLPNDEQITTARDMTILARAVQDRFPQYYPYFATRSFRYHGEDIRNHNHLLGRVDGVDGMKTGYIHDSGFNIVVSQRRDGHHLIAVVFGGQTARARDARVVGLLDDTFKLAAVKRTAPPVAEGKEIAEAHAKKALEKVATASMIPLPQMSRRPEPPVGSTEPIKAVPVKTFTVSAAQSPPAAPPAPEGYRAVSVSTGTNPEHVKTVAIVRREPPPAAEAKPGTLGVLPAKVAAAGAAVPLEPATPEPAAKPRAGWMIQIGAFPEEKEAKQRLAVAKDKVTLLGRADPFTEKVEKGSKALFRARFAGLDKEQAESACKHLKHSDIPCMVVKN